MSLIICYHLLFLLFHLFLNLKQNTYKKRVVIESVFSFLLLYFFWGFRDLPILNDTAHYYSHIRDYLNDANYLNSPFYIVDTDDRFEIGFLIYEKLVALIFNDPYAIINVSVFIITFANIYFVTRFTNKVLLSSFILLGTCLLSEYSGIRQGISVSIFLVAFIALLENKVRKYILLVLLAGTFHQSAYFFLLFLFLKYIEISKRNILLFIFLLVCCSLLLDIIWGMLGFEDSVYLERSSERNKLAIGSLLNTLISALIVFISYLSYNRRSCNVNKLMWWASMCTISFKFLDIQVQIMARFSNYVYAITVVLLICNLYNHKKIVLRRISIFVIVLLLIFSLIIIMMFRPEWNHLYPYRMYDFSLEYHNADLGY